jgi:hypothetical protein
MSSWYTTYQFGTQWWCRETNTWNQYFWEYKRQFRDTVDEYLNNSGDMFIWNWPIAISNNTWVQELYLINNTWDHRIFFKREYITGVDLNWDWFFTWQKEWLYSIKMLKLKWFDAGQNHNFKTWSLNWWVYDWFIDTRACDIEQGFVCGGDALWSWEFSGYKLPYDINDGRVDITDNSITISSRNLEIYPSKDPYLATEDYSSQIDPFMKINFTINYYGWQSNEETTLQTSIWFKSPYFNFKKEEVINPDIPHVCGDWW